MPTDESAAEQNGNLGESGKIRKAIYGSTEELHQIRLACANLKRAKNPGPANVSKFIDRVFEVAGVEW